MFGGVGAAVVVVLRRELDARRGGDVAQHVLGVVLYRPEVADVAVVDVARLADVVLRLPVMVDDRPVLALPQNVANELGHRHVTRELRRTIHKNAHF